MIIVFVSFHHKGRSSILFVVTEDALDLLKKFGIQYTKSFGAAILEDIQNEMDESKKSVWKLSRREVCREAVSKSMNSGLHVLRHGGISDWVMPPNAGNTLKEVYADLLVLGNIDLQKRPVLCAVQRNCLNSCLVGALFCSSKFIGGCRAASSA